MYRDGTSGTSHARAPARRCEKAGQLTLLRPPRSLRASRRYVAIVVQGAFVVFFRLCFYVACKYKENASR